MACLSPYVRCEGAANDGGRTLASRRNSSARLTWRRENRRIRQSREFPAEPERDGMRHDQQESVIEFSCSSHAAVQFRLRTGISYASMRCRGGPSSRGD